MSTREPSNRDILSAIQGAVRDLRLELRRELKKTNEKLDNVAETVDFLKENVAMRFELDDLRQEMKQGFSNVRNEIVDHVDHFIHLHKKQEVEHLALVSRMDRHEQAGHSI